MGDLDIGDVFLNFLQQGQYHSHHTSVYCRGQACCTNAGFADLDDPDIACEYVTSQQILQVVTSEDAALHQQWSIQQPKCICSGSLWGPNLWYLWCNTKQTHALHLEECCGTYPCSGGKETHCTKKEDIE